MYEIDTDGSSAPNVKQIEHSQTPSTTTVAPQSAKSPTVDHHKSRVPLIKFVGKRGAKLVKIDPPVVAAAAEKQKVSSKPQTGSNFFELKGGAFYGRPQYSTREIDSILSGGATEMFQ